jgi:sensor c-di-GMP phosphodiesterase-like protein
LIIKQKDKSLIQHHIAYTYSYTQSQHKPAKDHVTPLAEEPCGKPIKEQSLIDRARETFKNIQDTLEQSNISISSIFKNIKTYTFEEIKNKIQARYETIATERKDYKSPKHNVLLSDIFFWYVLINKMFIDKINFFQNFEPNFIETPYSGNWEASSIKQQTLENIRQEKFLSKPLPQAPQATETESYVHPFGV